MGFFSFGKKKKEESGLSGHPSSADKKKASIRRPVHLTASASASSSSTNTSGTDGGSPSPSPPQPPQPRRLHTFNGKQRPKRTSFAAADSSTPNLHANSLDKDVPPLPPLPTASSSSTPPARNSLAVPGPGALYANRGLVKQGSSNTLNSVKSNNRRGAHEAPPLSPDLMKLAKPRAMSYHAHSSIRNIWTTSTYGETMNPSTVTPSSAFGMPGAAAVKYASTGSPGMPRGSSYMNAHSNMGQHAADAEFKEYTRQYEAAISTAHNMAREYHHLPPNKRDKGRFEIVGQAFTAAARISREHWSYRCLLEKDRLSSEPHSLSGGDEMGSPHRVAGMRASEGWQYASMLAEAWGSADEVSQPLEEMPMPPMRFSSASWSNPSGGYLHPGYRPGALAAYSQPANGEIFVPAPGRSRLDSAASYDSLSSSYTHSALSHSMNRSRSHQALSSHGHGSGYVSSPLFQSTGISMPGAVAEEAPAAKVIVLKKGRKNRSRASSEVTGELNPLAESSKESSNHAS